MKNTMFWALTLVAMVAMLGCNAVPNEVETASKDSSKEKKTLTDGRMGKSIKTKPAVASGMKLVSGTMAPEITAKDTDGEVFNLSDYRGKVVMIDFWGDW